MRECSELVQRIQRVQQVVRRPRAADPGVLVPQTLHQSGDRFGSAARIGVEGANLQNEVRGKVS